MNFFLGDWLNSFFAWFIVAAAKSPNEQGDKMGNLNRIFKYLYQISLSNKTYWKEIKGV